MTLSRDEQTNIDLNHRAVISAEEAFRLLGIDRSTGYKAIREGSFPVPVLHIGRLIRVPTAALKRLLEVDQYEVTNPESED